MKARNTLLMNNKKIIFAFASFVLGAIVFLLLHPLSGYVSGLRLIWRHPGALISDFITVGGLFPTLLNIYLTTWAAILLLFLLKVKWNGIVFAGLFTIAGFAFFGKTPFNIVPIWLGILTYSRLQHVPTLKLLGAYMFGTGLGPVVSYTWFAIPLSLWATIPLGLLVGVIAGYLIGPIATTILPVHKGYNLYHVGFTIGFISMLFATLFRALGLDLNVGTAITYEHHWFLFWLVMAVSILCLVYPLFNIKESLTGFKKTIREEGKLLSDFIEMHGLKGTLTNVGLLGLMMLVVVLVLRFELNGPMVGGIFTVMGFGAFGKHVTNVLPVMFGSYLATFLPNINLYDIGPSIVIFFVTALAPITIRYGVIAGVIAGFIHMVIAPTALYFQGGFDLYNNGFTAGFTAALIVIFVDYIKRPKIKDIQKPNHDLT
ncbi:MAG: DUF1576 domain-containing protein [Acholeplasmataceae bacterium]|nr:MAG: DUF1576 domain-containing protein [Acholeplasmataceae bacterium]